MTLLAIHLISTPFQISFHIASVCGFIACVTSVHCFTIIETLFVLLVCSLFPQLILALPNDKSLILVDENGKVVKDIIATRDMFAGVYYLKVSSGTPSSYTITPELPSDMYLSQNGFFHGFPAGVMNRTEYMASAIFKDGSSVSCNFTMTIIPCQHGLITELNVFNEVNATLIDNGEVVVANTNYSRNNQFCIPLKEYTYRITCIRPGYWDDEFCKVQFHNKHKISFRTLRVPANTTQEGIISFNDTQPPKITLPPLITVPSSCETRLEYDCENRQDGAVLSVIDKPGSTSMGYAPIWGSVNYDENQIAFKKPDPGLYPMQLVVSNPSGNRVVNFTLAVDQCPTGLEGIFISHESETNSEVLNLYDQDNNLVYSTSRAYSSKIDIFLCMKPGSSYLFSMSEGKKYKWEEASPIRVSDRVGLIAEFTLNRSTRSDDRHFFYDVLIPSNSSLSYSKTIPSSTWMMPRFKENWPIGPSGTWGSFTDSKHLYLRKSFSAYDLDHYSYFFVDTTTRDVAVIYLNGVEVLQVMNTTRSLFPLSLLTEGENWIAIDLTESSGKTNSSAILFDLKVFMVTSQLYLLSTKGTISSEQPSVDYLHPVTNAFDSKKNTYWNVTGYPASVTYLFPFNQKRLVNLIMIQQSYNDTPNSLRIEGVLEGNSTVLLHSLRSNTFMTKNPFEYIFFDNMHFYRGYRIVFESSVHSIPIGLRDIRFLYRKPFACEKKFSQDLVPANTILYEKCPFYQVGTKQMKCIEQDNQVFWVDDRSACLSRFPQKPMSFVDFTICIQGLYSVEFNAIRPNLMELITKNVMVLEKDIAFMMLRDVSTTDIYATQISIRFTVDYRMGDYIHFYLHNSIIPIFSSLVSEYIDPTFTGSFVEQPRLYNPVNWLLVITVLLFVLLIVSLVTIYLLIRGKSSKEPKKLRKMISKTEEKNGLLAEEI